MRAKWCFGLLAVVLVLSGCRLLGSPLSEKAVLSDLFNAQFKEAEAVVVSEYTTADMLSPENYDYFKEQLPELDRELFDAFLAANREAVPSADLLEITPKVIPISQEKLTEIFGAPEGKGWEVFYQTYGRVPGVQSFSRPGFSKDGKLALVYSGGQYDWLAGMGELLLMEQVDGIWKIKSRAMVWIS